MYSLHVLHNFVTNRRNYVTHYKFIICIIHGKMKKRIAILLTIILLISSSGFTLNKHYCNGELVNIFFLPHIGDCCDSSMPMDDDSCEDEFLGFLVDESLELVPTKNDLTTIVQWAHLAEPYELISNSGISPKPQKLALFSPPLSNIKIYLRVESFLN